MMSSLVKFEKNLKLCTNKLQFSIKHLHIAFPDRRFMGPTWGPSGADRTHVGPMLAPWTLLTGTCFHTMVLYIPADKSPINSTTAFKLTANCYVTLAMSVTSMKQTHANICQGIWKVPGDQQPGYWPSSPGIFLFQHPLRWRHNGRDGVSNHQPHDCLLNRLLRRRSKKTSTVRVTGLCAGNSPGTGEFPAQMASNAENVSIWWRHYDRENFDIRQWSKIALSTELAWPFIEPSSCWILIIFHQYGVYE